MIKFLIFLLGFVVVVEDSIISASPSFSAEKITTWVIVHVIANDAKVIGSGVGGAFVRIKNLETGEVLAQGKQKRQLEGKPELPFFAGSNNSQKGTV